MYLIRKVRRITLVVMVCLGSFIIGFHFRSHHSRAARWSDVQHESIAPTTTSSSNSPSSISSSSSNGYRAEGTFSSGHSVNNDAAVYDELSVKSAVDALFQGANMTRWKKVYENQLQRQRQLAKACQELGLGKETPNFKTSDMYVNDSMQYIYCVVNKVACTTWKRVLLMASGQMTVDRAEKLSMTFVHRWQNTDRYMPRIRNYNLDEIKQRLQTHFKFMFVRHPLERLVSTYRDKFTKPAYYYKRRFGTKIIRAIRGDNATQQALAKGNDVKFREMVLYLLDPGPVRRKDDRLLSDNHWRLQNDLCHPCYVRYNFIGHYETLVEDALFVLRRLGVEERVQFPDSDPDNRWKKKTAEIAADFISQISPTELNRVRQLYRTDFELFNYDNSTVSG